MPRKVKTTKYHPAPYSMEIIAVFAKMLPAGTRIHDPFAGGGERLGALADQLGCTFTGTDIEAPFISDPRVRHGNACVVSDYPPRYVCPVCGSGAGRGHLDKRPLIANPLAGNISICTAAYDDVSRGTFTVVTSPVYPNGIADDFHAQDNSRRRTYRSARAQLTGEDQPLHDDNQGRWGYRGTPLHSTSRAMYWSITRRAIAAWTAAGADRAIVNVSDFTWGKGAVMEPVVDGWAQQLLAAGWTIRKAHKVRTPRDGLGSNQRNKVDYEVVIDAYPPATTGA